jgi:hypothetical protein
VLLLELRMEGDAPPAEAMACVSRAVAYENNCPSQHFTRFRQFTKMAYKWRAGSSCRSRRTTLAGATPLPRSGPSELAWTQVTGGLQHSSRGGVESQRVRV